MGKVIKQTDDGLPVFGNDDSDVLVVTNDENGLPVFSKKKAASNGGGNGLNQPSQSQSNSPAQSQSGGNNYVQRPFLNDNPEYTKYADSVLKQNADKNFVQRYLYPDKFPKLQTNKIQGADESGKPYSSQPDDEYSTHLMSYDPGSKRVYPEVVQLPNGQLKHLSGDEAWNYADKTGEYIQFKTADEAKKFADNGYKRGNQFIQSSPQSGSVKTFDEPALKLSDGGVPAEGTTTPATNFDLNQLNAQHGTLAPTTEENAASSDKLNILPQDMQFSLIDEKGKLEKELQALNPNDRGQILIKQEQIANIDKQIKNISFKATEKANSQKQVDNAISNTAKQSLSSFSLSKPVGKNVTSSSTYQQKSNELRTALNNGTLIVSKNNKGEDILARPKGRVDNLLQGIDDAWNANKEANKILGMNSKQLAEYAKNQKDEGYLPEKADQSSLEYQLGSAVPLVGKGMVAATTGAVMSEAVPEIAGFSTEGLAPFLAWMNTVPDMAKQAKAQSLLNNFSRYKQQHPEAKDEEAFEKARNVSDADFGEALATGTLMNSIGANVLPKGTGQGLFKALGQFAGNLPKSAIDMGLISAGGSEAKDAFAKTQGLDVSDTEKLNNAFESFKNAAVLQVAFDVLHGTTGGVKEYPKYVKAQSLEVLSKLPPDKFLGAIEQSVQDGKITQEQADKASATLGGFVGAKKKIIPTGNEEKDAVVTGLIQKKKNLEEEKRTLDESFHKEKDNEIADIDGKINLAKNSDNPLQFESDDLTGEHNLNPKSHDELSGKEKEGIKVPPEYGGTEVEEIGGKGEDAEKKYKPTAYFTENKGKLELKQPIEVGDKTYSDKQKAQEAADKALKQHYYENGLHESGKPQKKQQDNGLQLQKEEETKVTEPATAGAGGETAPAQTEAAVNEKPLSRDEVKSLHDNLTPEQKQEYLDQELEGKGDEYLKSLQQNTASKKLFITKDDTQQLYDLGYSKDEVNKFTPEQAQEILNNGTTKIPNAATEEKPKEEPQAEVVQPEAVAGNQPPNEKATEGEIGLSDDFHKAVEKATKDGTFEALKNIPENNINEINGKIKFIQSQLDETHNEYDGYQNKVTKQSVIQGMARTRLLNELDRLEANKPTEQPNKLKEIEDKYTNDIHEANKADLKLDLVPDEDLSKHEDARKLRKKQQDIVKRLSKLQELVKCK